MLFGGNPRYENMPLIGRGSPPPTVPWAPKTGWAESSGARCLSGNSRLDEVLQQPHPGSFGGAVQLVTQGHGVNDIGLNPEDQDVHVRSWVSSKWSQ